MVTRRELASTVGAAEGGEFEDGVVEEADGVMGGVGGGGAGGEAVAGPVVGGAGGEGLARAAILAALSVGSRVSTMSLLALRSNLPEKELPAIANPRSLVFRARVLLAAMRLPPPM